MELLIVTGMSGSGKSQAAHSLEDMGYFCIDNLPPQLVTELVHVFTETEREAADSSSTKRLALIMDVRNPNLSRHLLPELEKLEEQNVVLRILFLDASNDTLIRRYKETRRNHPLAENRTLNQAIDWERRVLEPLRTRATDLVDTSKLTIQDLRDTIFRLFTDQGENERLQITIQSFGFKYGLPSDCDNVLDVRFIPNPFYEVELREQSGLDQAVRDFIWSFPETAEYLDLIERFYAFVLPYYRREGKMRLSIGVGCTGGRHRSVALTEALADWLREQNYRVLVDHRDLGKDRYPPPA